jgi:hypothetical protein
LVGRKTHTGSVAVLGREWTFESFKSKPKPRGLTKRARERNMGATTFRVIEILADATFAAQNLG